MLDTKLVAYLLAHPDTFSDVLARMFSAMSTTTRATTFTGRRSKMPTPKAPGRRKLPDPPQDLTRPAVQPPKESDEDLWEFLVQDAKNEIIQRVVETAIANDRVFVDLTILALVSKNLRADIKRHLRDLETRFDPMPAYCRALFEYANDRATFHHFFTKVARYAPAVAAAWRLLLKTKKSTMAAEFGAILAHLLSEAPPRRFQAAIENDGFDPIATALCMHEMVRANGAPGFSDVNWRKLHALVLDKTWALFMCPLQDEGQWSHIPALVDHRHLLHACVVRCSLHEETADFFMRLLTRLGTRLVYRPSTTTPTAREKVLWKRIAAIGRDGEVVLRVVLFLLGRHVTQDNRFILYLEEREDLQGLLYQWVRCQQRRTESPLELFHIVHDALATFETREMKDSLLATLVLGLAHRRTPPSHLETMLHLIHSELPDLYEFTAREVLHAAVKRGNAALVETWLHDLYPACGAPHDMRRLLTTLMHLETVIHRDPEGQLQERVLGFFLEAHIDTVRAFFLRSTLPQDFCVSPASLELVRANVSINDAMLDQLRQARRLFYLQATRGNIQVSADPAVLFHIYFRGELYTFPNTVKSLFVMAYIGSRLAVYRPAVARTILATVFARVQQLFREDVRTAMALCNDLCELSPATLPYFILHPVFTSFVTHHVDDWSSQMSYIFKHSTNLPLLVRVLQALPTWLAISMVRGNMMTVLPLHDLLQLFTFHNLLFRYLSHPNYAIASQPDVSYTPWRTSQEQYNMSDLYRSAAKVKSISRLEALYKATYKL